MVRWISSATHRLPSSIALRSLSAVPARANGVRTPAMIATRRPDAERLHDWKVVGPERRGKAAGVTIQSMTSPRDDPRTRQLAALASRRSTCWSSAAASPDAASRAMPRCADFGRARREGRLCERNVEPVVASDPRRRPLPRARASAPRVRVERANGDGCCASRRISYGRSPSPGRCMTARESRVEAGRGARALRRARAVPKRRTAPASQPRGRARREPSSSRTGFAAARATSTRRRTTRDSHSPTPSGARGKLARSCSTTAPVDGVRSRQRAARGCTRPGLSDGTRRHVHASVVVNATGPWSDDVRRTR